MDETFIIAAFRALGEENVQNVKVNVLVSLVSRLEITLVYFLKGTMSCDCAYRQSVDVILIS